MGSPAGACSQPYLRASGGVTPRHTGTGSTGSYSYCIWLDIFDKSCFLLFYLKLNCAVYHLNRYETLVGTIGKKFAKKRDHANYEEDENGNIKPIKAKKMFLKPKD
jgi:hypothetical protein